MTPFVIIARVTRINSFCNRVHSARNLSFPSVISRKKLERIPSVASGIAM